MSSEKCRLFWLGLDVYVYIADKWEQITFYYAIIVQLTIIYITKPYLYISDKWEQNIVYNAIIVQLTMTFRQILSN